MISLQKLSKLFPGVGESERQTYGVPSTTALSVPLMHKAFIHLDSPISISETIPWTWGEVCLRSTGLLSKAKSKAARETCGMGNILFIKRSSYIFYLFIFFVLETLQDIQR